MSKKIWNKEAFEEKNRLRKLYKDKDHAAYIQGRKYRREFAINGCFGNVAKKVYNEYAIGTSGYKDQ
jgi:hypothetical protein